MSGAARAPAGARVSPIVKTSTVRKVLARLMVALAVSALAGSPIDAKHLAATPAGGLTLRQQVGQLIVVGFEGTSVPATLVPTLNRGGVSGVILFGRNVASRSQLRSL